MSSHVRHNFPCPHNLSSFWEVQSHIYYLMYSLCHLFSNLVPCVSLKLWTARYCLRNCKIHNRSHHSFLGKWIMRFIIWNFFLLENLPSLKSPFSNYSVHTCLVSICTAKPKHSRLRNCVILTGYVHSPWPDHDMNSSLNSIYHLTPFSPIKIFFIG